MCCRINLVDRDIVLRLTVQYQFLSESSESGSTAIDLKQTGVGTDCEAFLCDHLRYVPRALRMRQFLQKNSAAAADTENARRDSCEALSSLNLRDVQLDLADDNEDTQRVLREDRATASSTTSASASAAGVAAGAPHQRPPQTDQHLPPSNLWASFEASLRPELLEHARELAGMAAACERRGQIGASIGGTTHGKTTERLAERLQRESMRGPLNNSAPEEGPAAANEARQELSLFLGAGVGIGAGLPGWFTLLEMIEDQVTGSGPGMRKVGDQCGWDPLRMAAKLEKMCSAGGATSSNWLDHQDVIVRTVLAVFQERCHDTVVAIGIFALGVGLGRTDVADLFSVCSVSSFLRGSCFAALVAILFIFGMILIPRLIKRYAEDPSTAGGNKIVPFRHRIAALVNREHHSLLMALAAALPVKTIVTTNYDQLAEQASESVNIKDKFSRQQKKGQPYRRPKKAPAQREIESMVSGAEGFLRLAQQVGKGLDNNDLQTMLLEHKAVLRKGRAASETAGQSMPTTATASHHAQSSAVQQHPRNPTIPTMSRGGPGSHRDTTAPNMSNLARQLERHNQLPPTLSVLPYYPVKASSRIILKMHGDVDFPQDLVITGDDYCKYDTGRTKALAGLVQSSLMTSHFLFLGFSMTDANYLRILEEVREALVPHVGNVGCNAASKDDGHLRKEQTEKRKTDERIFSSCSGPLSEDEEDAGTSGQPRSSPLFRSTTATSLQLGGMATTLTVDSWGKQETGEFRVNCLAMHPGTAAQQKFTPQMISVAARSQEIFLDLVSLLCSQKQRTKHVFDDRFASMLTPEESVFKRTMLQTLGRFVAAPTMNGVDGQTPRGVDGAFEEFVETRLGAHTEAFEELVETLESLGLDWNGVVAAGEEFEWGRGEGVSGRDS